MPPLLEGAEIDYVGWFNDMGFAISNPNIENVNAGGCGGGCGGGGCGADGGGGCGGGGCGVAVVAELAAAGVDAGARL